MKEQNTSAHQHGFSTLFDILMILLVQLTRQSPTIFSAARIHLSCPELPYPRLYHSYYSVALHSSSLHPPFGGTLFFFPLLVSFFTTFFPPRKARSSSSYKWWGHTMHKQI
ncbi:hypothetical protein CEXT_733661 [Caerostris extrusa]|uniref:Uncharacterized protein n=1 Tax=Caerostris extrusa TaxID=172846 RepID=A0AAV4U1K8_CAEEX|nr:hypothetical protein CEXT_733661 [Caerostris extrusa]